MKLATIRTRLGKATPTANRIFLNGPIIVQPKKINNLYLNGSQNGQFWSVLVNFGQSWSILVNFGLFWSILVNFGQFWSMLVNSGQF